MAVTTDPSKTGISETDALALTGTTLAPNVVNASLNSITPTGGTLAVTGSVSASTGVSLGVNAPLQFTAGSGTAPYLQHTSNTLDVKQGASGLRVLNNAGTVALLGMTDGATTQMSVTGSISATQTIRAQGVTPPASGAGLELFYNAATPLAGVEAYDRTGGAPLPLALSGSSVKLVASAGVYNINNIPTSSAGLSAGDLWSDGGTIKIV